MPDLRDETETQIMKNRQNSQTSRAPGQNTTPVRRSDLADLGDRPAHGRRGQRPNQLTTNRGHPAQACGGPDGPGAGEDGPVKSCRVMPMHGAVARPAPVVTNITAVLADALLEVRPRVLFLEDVPELLVEEPKANELTLGGHTYSGIVVQFIKAKRPLQLLDPAAPVQYGSGWTTSSSFRAALVAPRSSCSPSISSPAEQVGSHRNRSLTQHDPQVEGSSPWARETFFGPVGSGLACGRRRPETETVWRSGSSRPSAIIRAGSSGLRVKVRRRNGLHSKVRRSEVFMWRPKARRSLQVRSGRLQTRSRKSRP